MKQENTTPEQENVTREQETFQTKLPDSKRTALLRYIAVLFAAAFVLVLLSMVLQIRSSNSTITQLHQSSTSALEKAQILQETNRDLEQQLSYATDVLARARKEAEEEREDIRTAYDALVYLLTTEPAEGDVEYTKALETVENQKDNLSDAARAIYETWAADTETQTR